MWDVIDEDEKQRKKQDFALRDTDVYLEVSGPKSVQNGLSFHDLM